MRLTGLRGFTLVELMISLAVGLVVLAGLVTAYSNTLAGTSAHLRATRLDHDLRTHLEHMLRDLRRAGYSGVRAGYDNDADGSLDERDLLFNPFTVRSNDLRTGAAAGEAADSCILFSYNLDADDEYTAGSKPGPRVGVCSRHCSTGPFEDTGNVEQFGYQLKNGALRMRTGGAEFKCNSGSWQTITDPSLRVTKLAFRIRQGEFDLSDGDQACNSGHICRYVRAVDIEFEAMLVGALGMRRRVHETVHVRNDKLPDSIP